ncbi:MAG: ABC transporter substrate-binding protein [Dehalococcoidia bacterium]
MPNGRLDLVSLWTETRHPAWRLSLLFQAAVATGLLSLWACASPTPTPTVTPTLPAPVFHGSIVMASPAAVHQLDVHQEATEALLSLGPGIVYSRLLRIQSGSDVALPSLAVECDLCSRWDHPDPLTYLFHLRPGIRWHNIAPVNGRELTAQDVVFSLDRLRTPGWPGAALLRAVTSVEAVDKLTISFRLAYPDADFLVELANGLAKVVAPEAVELHGDLREGPTIGTGPWVLAQSSPDEFRFEANPGYYERGLPEVGSLTIVPSTDPSSRLAALFTGLVDLTTVDAEGWDRLEVPQVQLSRGMFPQPGTGILLGLNANKTPFDRLKVRQAIFQALDPWRALEDSWQGQGEVALGVPVVSGEWLLSEEEMRRYLANPDRVDALLTRVGTELPVTFTLTVADYGDRYLALGEKYRVMLRDAGFQPTMNRINPRVYAEEVWDKGNFQAFLGPLPPIHTPNAFLFGLLHSRGRWSPTGYASEELDLLIEEQSTAEERRGDLVLEIQRHVLDKAILFMPVTGTSLWAWHERVQGFAPNFAASEYFHWARLSVKEE